MTVKLAANEKIVREYNYARTREGFINKRITKNSLLVTNKRIIKMDTCDKTGYSAADISEILVEAITGLNTKTSSRFKFGLLIAGIVAALIGLVLLISSSGNAAPIVFGLIAMAIGGLFIYRFVKSRRNVLNCNFIVADRINNAMYMGAATYNSLFSALRVSGKSKFVKIVVDGAVAEAFASEIGALLLDIKAGLMDPDAAASEE